ncbi:MAG: hypothetical protein JWM22_523 [Frankiales bacterium]|nr:hypothetical protein [Frankiales bacterium]
MTTPTEHYRGQRLALTELYGGLAADDLSRPVHGCPEWQVKDVLAHLVGVPLSLRDGDMGDAGSPAWTRRQVAAGKSKSVPQLLDEWSAEGPAFEAGLADRGFLGWVFTYDVTMHGNDVLEALGRPLGSSPTHTVVLDGIIDRARARAEGIGTLNLRAGERRWALGDGEPAATLTLPDEGELARVIGARRSDDVVRQMDWTGDPEPWIPVLPLFRDR